MHLISPSRRIIHQLFTRSCVALSALALACAHNPPPPESVPASPVSAAPSSGGTSDAPVALEITTEEVTYRAGDTELKGFLAAPKNASAAPGILVVHEWWGQNEYAQRRARMLAELGYVALAVDLYGGGKTTSDPKEAGQLAQAAYSDIQSLKQKFLAGRERLMADSRVDGGKLGAVGYCFGGGVILNMVRMGVPLDAVASFHGTLKADQPLAKGSFSGNILIETGEADPMVPPADVDAIRTELTNAGVSFQIDVYPGAKHAFTNPAATDIGKRYNLPVAYDASADEKSWQALTAMLSSVWSKS